MFKDDSGSAAQIDLATTPDFDIGNLHVRPRRLDISPSGQPSRGLEPRVMQVLVALTRANEEVVSRDQLAELCWGGRIVGDHSLNRCIHALRHLASEIDPLPFEIETIPRIGYRLARCPTGRCEDYPKPTGQPSLAPQLSEFFPGTPGEIEVRKKRGKRYAALFGVLILLLSFALALRWQPSVIRPSPTVAIVDSRGNPSSEVARALGVDLMQFAGARANEFAVVQSPKDADFVIRINLRSAKGVAQADTELLDGHKGNVLWSGSVEALPQQTRDIAPQMAAKVTNVLLCAAESTRIPSGLDQGTVKIYLAACERKEDHPDEHLVGLLRKVTSLAPQFGEGWADLAAAEATLHAMARAGPQTVRDEGLASAARSHIARARTINPKLGATYVAEAELLPPYRFEERLKVLESGIAQDPYNAQLYDHFSLALFRVGRTTEAIIAAERASTLNPSSPVGQASLIASLMHAGNLPAARGKLIIAERLWPNSAAIMNVSFSMEYRYGDAKKAQELMERGRSGLGGRSGGFGGPAIAMRARLNPSAENVARLIKFAAYDARLAPQAAPLRLQALGQFDAVDQAYQMIEQPGVLKHLAGSTDVIFRPHLGDFRKDPRFPTFATRLGLMQYWSKTNSWPDFCSDPLLPYDCRSESRRILRQRKAN